MSRSGAFKTDNQYQKALDADLYSECPKAVLAAIAVSLLTDGGDTLGDGDVSARLAQEWDILHANGIVPQRPSRAARAVLAALARIEELGTKLRQETPNGHVSR